MSRIHSRATSCATVLVMHLVYASVDGGKRVVPQHDRRSVTSVLRGIKYILKDEHACANDVYMFLTISFINSA